VRLARRRRPGHGFARLGHAGDERDRADFLEANSLRGAGDQAEAATHALGGVDPTGEAFLPALSYGLEVAALVATPAAGASLGIDFGQVAVGAFGYGDLLGLGDDVDQALEVQDLGPGGQGYAHRDDPG
jgi:hypothetical protein